MTCPQPVKYQCGFGISSFQLGGPTVHVLNNALLDVVLSQEYQLQCSLIVHTGGVLETTGHIYLNGTNTTVITLDGIVNQTTDIYIAVGQLNIGGSVNPLNSLTVYGNANVTIVCYQLLLAHLIFLILRHQMSQYKWPHLIFHRMPATREEC
jgi:hypothetical protein